MEKFRKYNKCFKSGEEGHVSCVCPKRNELDEPPRATMIRSLKGEGHCKGSLLFYAWEKVGEHDTLILFYPGYTHNFISIKLATKLGVHDLKIG